MGSLTAAKDQQSRRMVGTQRGDIEELGTNRDTHYLGVVKVLRGLFKVNGSRRYPSAHDLIGKSRHIVCLEGQRRDAAQNGSRHRRTRCISAHSYDYVRFEDANDFSRMKDSQW